MPEWLRHQHARPAIATDDARSATNATARAAALPSLAAADWLARPATQAVFSALERAGFPARAVGGVVRNALMGLAVADIDIATPATPDEVIAAATAAGLRALPTGAAHGTVTVVAGHIAHEVTTLRCDVATDGRRATVAFTRDWAEDAARRDFTINALYCDAHGVVHDPLGGYPDVVARRVRFIGDADRRIAEDYLRILRFYRFHAVLGDGPLCAAGLAATVRGRRGLQRLSAERVRAEMVKLLVGRRAGDAIAAMSGHGLLLPVLRVAPRPGVLATLIAAESRLARAPDAMARLAALALAVADDAPRLADRLRLSNAERQALVVVDPAALAGLPHLDDRVARRHLYALGPEAWRRHILAATAIWPQVARLSELHALPERWPLPRLPVQGADVLALGVAPGPAVGRTLAAVEQRWIAADFPERATVLAWLPAAVAAG